MLASELPRVADLAKSPDYSRLDTLSLSLSLSLYIYIYIYIISRVQGDTFVHTDPVIRNGGPGEGHVDF